ncbi:DUF484 family protein [Sulfurivirga sp.]|uniref:DUF484 family protein n=1 Tax=Sulfurivirga sp. TaxID=2614236 RepID=UPI0025F7B36B|nr:DUF484 family protein [Sulfurivirga sp.]
MSELRPEQVADWLARHPDFFHHHPELVEQLSVPHPDHGRAVSLLEHQLHRLRARKAQLEQDVAAMVAIASDNGQLFERLHQLICALLSTHSDQAAVALLRVRTQALFGLDQVQLVTFEVPATPVAGLSQLGPSVEWVHALRVSLTPGNPRCGPLEARWRRGLFAEMPPVRSACMVPLGFRRVWGVLALGSSSADFFSPDLDTYFLSQMGLLISARLGHLFDDACPY